MERRKSVRKRSTQSVRPFGVPKARIGKVSLLRAIDQLILNRPDGARAILQTLLETAEDRTPKRLLDLAEALERGAQLRREHRSILRHEIGNSLAIVQTTLEGMVDGIVEPKRDCLMGVLSAVQAADRLLSELTREPHEPDEILPISLETFDICALIDDAVRSATGAARAKGIKLTYLGCGVQRRGYCVTFRGDPTRVAQVLQNLLVNAVRYTPAGGSITLECDNTGGDLRVTVHNTGPGIANDELERVFECGYRGRRSGSVAGSGLGLAIVNDVITRLGGAVRVASEEGQGATFTLIWPASCISFYAKRGGNSRGRLGCVSAPAGAAPHR